MGSQSVDTLSAAQSAISNVDLAIGKVSLARGDLGAFQNRLGLNIRNSENSIENNQASESAIRDADIAFEVEEFTKSQILVQSTTAMLAQANVIPQGALSLLQ
jgi:flagellin